MKVILALVASAAALADAPAAFNEPTWRQTWPSASGLLQTSVSACEKFGTVGVTCRPSDQALFAVGMSGDENLGQEILMKGNKFNYHQSESSLAQVAQAPFPQYESQAPEKVLVPQTTHARYHSTYY